MFQLSNVTTGDRIREIRKALRLSQGALAKRLAVKPQAISNWERGASHPRPEYADALARISGQSLDWLAGRTNGPIKLSGMAFVDRSNPGDAERIEEQDLPSRARAFLGPGREIWQVRAEGLDRLGFYVGAYIVVDLNEKARPGDFVIAIQRTGGEETALLRMCRPPRLFPVSPGQEVLTVDNHNIILKGPIIATLQE